MPPSQLKRLKSTLREQGVVGPQKSKKQKRVAGKSGVTKDKRVQRSVALQNIREQFNPFELKAPVRESKYDFTNGGRNGTRVGKGVIGRPGVTKGLGEETRRKTLLVEMRRRQKVGGIVDRRFGENDPTMAPEDKALERFVKEKQRGGKKSSIFDLEDDEGDQEELTHLGRSLSIATAERMDDFDEAGLGNSDSDDPDAEGKRRSLKRRRLSEDGSANEVLSDPKAHNPSGKVKTKQEVMKEVMAKSKLHKYERQKAKEDDDDLRMELDQGMSDIYALLRGTQRQPEIRQVRNAVAEGAIMNPDRAALLDGKDRAQADKEYDERLRQLTFDARSKPTERTKTEEERLSDEAQRLRELEEKRLSRMRGEDSSDTDDNKSVLDPQAEEDIYNDMEDFLGFGSGIPTQEERLEPGVEDEDDFILDDNLIASGSEADLSDNENDSASQIGASSDEDREFTEGLLLSADVGRAGFDNSNGHATPTANESSSTIAYTFPCPQTHDELLQILQGIPVTDLPTVIQRIRALYHPKLNDGNKAKLGVFSAILVDHIYYLANQATHPPFTIMEALIRHTHSLAKSFSDEVSRAFRVQLKSLQETRPTSPTPGDLMILTAIASIFPTSDHFHQVVTPAILSMARYLGQKVPQTLGDLVKGTYLGTLCLQCQRLSRRYIPELVNYILNVLYALSPAKPMDVFGCFPLHDLPLSLRINQTCPPLDTIHRKLQFWDINHVDGTSPDGDEELKATLLKTNILLLDTMAELWVGKSAFYEMFDPFSKALHHLSSKACFTNLQPPVQTQVQKSHKLIEDLLRRALIARRPLRLHNHRPLAIKTSIPKFEESYNPSKHYDPDRDRAELSKLKAEHKRERKGAIRELRKDSNFIARENLREKKERDSQYEKKYKRLVAEIQGEEGKEANAYEREKRMRKGKR